MSLSFQKAFFAVSIAIFLSFTLSACKEDVPQPVEHIRAIKAITVTDRAFGLSRQFPGVVEAVDRASLSFEVSGNVKKLRVKVGDEVTNGKIIAVLDSRPFQLKVQAAEAKLGRSKAGLANKKKNLHRLQSIAKLDPGAVSGRSLDQAEASYESAQNTVSYSASQLNLAKRDLQKTKLMAPFDGVIAKRHVDPFKEVARGQPIYDVFIQGAMEAVIDIPETLIGGIHIGLQAEIRFPKNPDHIYQGTVSEISSAAGTASTFPVKVAIKDAGDQIRPGMSAEVGLLLSREDEESGYLIPVSALAPGDEKARAYVFIFDPESSTVKKMPVGSPAGLQDNYVAVKEGVKPGDIIAVAGVSFLEDGQKVKLMEGKGR